MIIYDDVIHKIACQKKYYYENNKESYIKMEDSKFNKSFAFIHTIALFPQTT